MTSSFKLFLEEIAPVAANLMVSGECGLKRGNLGGRAIGEVSARIPAESLLNSSFSDNDRKSSSLESISLFDNVFAISLSVKR